MKRPTIVPLLLSVVFAACGSSSGDGSESSCRVTTSSGTVQGRHRGASCIFLGVPFAAPPIGTLRWKPPEPAARWAPSTLDATHAPSPCPTVASTGTATIQGDEDCLRLNIWTPNPLPDRPAPVLVWIHDGAFVSGSANMAAHDGQNMAEQTGTVVVAVNYRLGPFGFLGHPALSAEDPHRHSSGNYGFLDQRAALVWVRENIAAFGGDPRNVTVAGQSAGAHSVSLHMVSPGSSGAFDRAIMQSGFASTRWKTLADAESQGSELAAALGCSDAAQVLACLRSRMPDDVLLALPSGQPQIAEMLRASWAPVVDGLEIPNQPRTLYQQGLFNHVPIIVGTTRDEGWVYVDRSFPAGLSAAVYAATVEGEFGTDNASAVLAMYPVADFPSPRDALARMAGDVEAVCEARRIARLVARTGSPVYAYAFEQEPDPPAPPVVFHGRDTNFVFGNNFDRPSYVLNTTERALATAMSGYWARFAATGNPNSSRHDGVQWPAYRHPGDHDTIDDPYIVFDSPIRFGERLREKACDFWEPFFLGSVVGSIPASQH